MQALTLIFAALLGCVLGATEVEWPSIHAKWSAGGLLSYIAGTAFFEIPSTQAEAQNKGWVEAREEDLVSMWCLEDDPRVCVLYDKKGSFAGMQISFPQEDLAVASYRWQEHNQFQTDEIFGVNVAAGRFYLVPQDLLESGGRSTIDEIGSGVWIQEGDTLTEIPLTADELVAENWTEENCIPTMGRHYYYNISETMDCQSMEPYFFLTDPYNDYVHGLGFQTFGQKTSLDRDWWETVPSIAIKPTLPNAPQCLVDWATDYTVLSLHVYFGSSPYFITCPLFK